MADTTSTPKSNMAELVIGLVTKVGIDTALIILDSIKNVKTIDDAIAALETSAGKTWADYKKEA